MPRKPARAQAVIYLRFSPRPNAAESESNETQFAYCRQYCEAHGYEIKGVFQDSAQSGDDVDRVELWNAIDACTAGCVLVAHKADRLARSVYLSEYIRQRIGKNKARIEIVDGSRNGDAPEDVFIRQILAAFSEFEKKVISARTKAAMLRHQAAGRAMGSIPPYGKKRGADIDGKRRWVDDPKEQAIIGRIMQEREAGNGFRKIARLLDAEGLLCRGHAWDHSMICRIVANQRRSIPA